MSVLNSKSHVETGVDSTVEGRKPIAGVDGAKDDHALAVVGASGEQTARFTVAPDRAGLRELVHRVLRAGVVEVCIERPDGAEVHALRQAGSVDLCSRRHS
jgi:hypothetical protein